MATFTTLSRTRAAVYFALSVLVMVLVSGCARLTSIELGPQPDPYRVSVKIDPPTLNPPQFGTLTFGVTQVGQPKPVTAFEPVWGALMHTVLIRRDLQYFRHTFTDHLVESEASIPTYFSSLGKYYNYTLFKPGGAPLQTFRATITTGDVEGPEPALVEDTNPVKTQGWLTFRLLKETDPIKSGRPTQLVINVSERGNQVQTLWPYLEASGHIWIVDEHGDNFAHLAGVSESRGMPAPGASTTEPTASPTESTEGPTATLPPVPTFAPTFAPGIISALATAGAAPRPQLAPVQQTALASILQTPEVSPPLGYGPDVAFTHTFPHPGLYKVWLEIQYRAQVIVVDYVLKVE